MLNQIEKLLINEKLLSKRPYQQPAARRWQLYCYLRIMHRYFIKTPWLVRKLYPDYVWRLPTGDRKVYLTFDDGPQKEVTPWVLDMLREYNAVATFFCIGKNVREEPAIYRRIREEGHGIGNHSHTHPNGWNTGTGEYLDDVSEAAQLISSHLFRPPYGRIKSAQANGMAHAMKVEKVKIIMWDVLSADFDPGYSGEQCLRNVTRNTEDGSVIVFHDSVKAFPNLQYCLPRALEWIKEKGLGFGRIDELV